MNEKQYPLKHLVFAIQQHCAPRKLQVKNITSTSVCPSNSILAGCFHSVPFIKGLLHDELLSFEKSFPVSPMCSHVDDCVQFVHGTYDKVQNLLVLGALKWANSTKKLKLVMSAKSAVVTSNYKLSNAIVKELANLGIVLVAKPFSRDLGIHFTGGKSRVTKLLDERGTKAKKRNNKVMQLARTTRRARKLYRSGVYPQATWGHEAVGFSPTQAKSLRRMCSASTGIKSGGKCSTTAIFVGFGHRNDPVQIAVKETMCEYFDLLQTVNTSWLRAHLDLAWKAAVDRVSPKPQPSLPFSFDSAKVSMLPDIKKVCGIISNVVFILLTYGWKPVTFAKWIDTFDTTWYFPATGFPRQHVIYALQDTISLTLWKTASHHHAGKGLHSGLAWAPSTQLVRSLRPKEPAKAAAIETIMCACCWSPARTLAAYPHSQPVECECGHHNPDDYHSYWGCPLLLNSTDQVILDSNKYISDCDQQCVQYPCLWFRGLLPAALITTSSAPLATYPNFIVGPHIPVGLWPGGFYGTDCSGGIHSSVPSLRRVGIGICCLDPSPPHAFQFGLWTALCGEIQTTPRGELYAFVVLLNNAMCNQVFHVFSDSLINVNNYFKGVKHCKTVPNGDLWDELFGLLALKKCSLVLEYVPSHVFTNVKKTHIMTSEFAIFNNTCADALAEYAASRVEVDPGTAAPILRYHKLASIIQLRLYAVITTIVKVPHEKQVKQPVCMSLESRIAFSSHAVSVVQNRLCCSLCRSSVSMSSVAAWQGWINTECVSPDFSDSHCKPCKLGPCVAILGKQRAHVSHSLYYYRGITYCNKCGCRGIDKYHNLSKPCVKPTLYGTNTKNAISRGALPPGLTRWPDKKANPLHVDAQVHR